LNWVNTETVDLETVKDVQKEIEEHQIEKADNNKICEKLKQVEQYTTEEGPTEKICPKALTKDKVEFLRLHERLDHMPKGKMLALARAGVIPKKFAECTLPMCSSCVFGRATCQPWRTKGKKESIQQPNETKSGENTSVDTLKSTVSGLIPQMSGFLTHTRYWAATVFVNHVSEYNFVHFQKQQTNVETLQAKAAYKRHAAKSNVTIKKYHADNGRFANKAFKDEVQESNQTITYCGVCAHFQNGITKRMIRSLSEGGRTLLLRAQHQWSEVIKASL